MCVDLVRGKQPNFVKLMKTCQMHRRNCAVKTFVETKRKKIKTGSEYLYYIPREVTLSLYDCEPSEGL